LMGATLEAGMAMKAEVATLKAEVATLKAEVVEEQVEDGARIGCAGEGMAQHLCRCHRAERLKRGICRRWQVAPQA